jgi:drug/metabolite transporter (DMT)-like permease
MSLFAFAVPRLGASGFAILANAELVTVVLIGILVLGEAVTAARSAGALLIITGILAFGLSQRASHRPAESRVTPETVTAA